MRTSTLVKLELNKYVLRVRLVQRGAETQTFTFCREALSRWLNGNSPFQYTEKDYTSVAVVHPYREKLVMSFQFLDWAGNDLYRLVERSISLPLWEVQEFLNLPEGKRSFLCKDEPTPQAELVWHVDEYMQPILSGKRKRNALRKAMRDEFHWRYSVVHLYPDGNDSFYFQEEDGINGGLILTQSRDGRYEYSVHT